jgi:predicted histidine transporter YuiF (NhaC family)
MRIGTKDWNQSVPEIMDELVGMLGMLALVVLIAAGFLVVYTLHPR